MDKFLLEQFNKLAIRPALKIAKQKLDDAIDSVPVSLLVRELEEAFRQVTDNADPAKLIEKLDVSKIVPAIDKVKDQINNPVVALAVAKTLKEAAKRGSAESLQDVVNQIPNLGPQERFFAKILVSQLGDKMEDLANASTQSIATQLIKSANKLSGEQIAAQLSVLLQIAPKMLPKEATPDFSYLPQPQDIANATIEVIQAASDALGNAIAGETFADTLNALKNFPAAANDILSRIPGLQLPPSDAPKNEKPANDDQPKQPKPPRRKKGGPGTFDI